MKCEHGNEVKVYIQVRDGYWNEGIVEYNSAGEDVMKYYGTPTPLPKATYARVLGCSKCNFVELDIA